MLVQKLNNKLIYYLGFIGVFLLLIIRTTFIASDTAWHLKIGEYISRLHSIPHKDTMSLLSSERDINFVAHEWLWDFLIYKVFLNEWTLIAITCIFVYLSFILCAEKSKNAKTAILLSSLFILVNFSKTMVIRPDTFSAIIFIMLGYNFIYEENLKKALCIDIILTILLVNIHGSMATPNLVQQLWLLFCTYFISKEKLQGKIYIFLCTFLSGIISPFGLKNYKFIQTINPVKDVFSDWSAFQFKTSLQALIVIGVFAYTGYCIAKIEKINPMDLSIMFMYIVLLFSYERTLNIFIFGFILYFSKYIKLNSNYILYLLLSVFVAVLVVIFGSLPKTDILETYVSKEIQDEIKGKRVLNDISLGGYLIYNDIKPFIDTRVDPFISTYGNEDIFTPYIKAIHSENLMNKLVEKYNIQYLLLLKNNIASQIFYSSSDWIIISEDDNCVLFARKS